MKQLKDMNLVDDFLVYSLTVHKTYGEEASRYILECILQRRIRRLTVVPQKPWPGENPEKHGVRLDVYLDEEDGEIFDIEPDNNSSARDVNALPRRVRFYHAKIDSGNLAAGEDYNALRNVLVLFITTYDPFGRDRMVYTIQNGCVEMPELPYDDGARTIFLYTRGTEGNPPEELRQLMQYMEHSTLSNAQTAGLARLHQMVTDVKADREVGLTYMKSYEIERFIKAEEKAENMIQLLSRFRDVPEDEQERIRSEKNLKVLDSWYEDALQYMEDTLRHKEDALQQTKDALQQMEAKVKSDIILKLLDDYEIPEVLKNRILSETSPEVLELWFQAARHAKSLGDFTEKAAL